MSSIGRKRISVAWLESFVSRVKHASPEERDAMLDEVSFEDHLEQASKDLKIPLGVPVRLRQSNLQVGAEGSLIYHGPTSIYLAGQFYEPERQEPPFTSVQQSARVARHFGLQDSLITQALQDFFKWQYPHFMFIYRGAFLRDHYSNSHSGKYWSPPLLYAICALGTLMATDKSEEDVSERFFAAAESILMVSGLEQPCVTNVQAFLCMAFYEMGRGNLSKGWAFSGIAFRMGYDIGFQRDPCHWTSTDHSITTVEDIEIRRRIYWGCYLSDKLISLMLGRTTYLDENDATVGPIDTLPSMQMAGSFARLVKMKQVGANHSVIISARRGIAHGLKNVPLIFVYAIVQAASAILMLDKTAHHRGDGQDSTSTSANLELVFLMQALDECSATWFLALQAKKIVLRFIKGMNDSSELETGVQEAGVQEAGVQEAGVQEAGVSDADIGVDGFGLQSNAFGLGNAFSSDGNAFPAWDLSQLAESED
ncbi:hypothetical protein B7463_g6213, partial [Scytalidium lignicola]